MAKDWKAVSAIRHKYVGLKHEEVLKRDRLLKELEAERKVKIKEVETNHKNEVSMVHEAFSQAMGELGAAELDEIEGAQK
jgi:hypothetical protein